MNWLSCLFRRFYFGHLWRWRYTRHLHYRFNALCRWLRKEHICPVCGRDKRTMPNMGGFDGREIVKFGFPLYKSFHRYELCNICNPAKSWIGGRFIYTASILGGLSVYKMPERSGHNTKVSKNREYWIGIFRDLAKKLGYA